MLILLFTCFCYRVSFCNSRSFVNFTHCSVYGFLNLIYFHFVLSRGVIDRFRVVWNRRRSHTLLSLRIVGRLSFINKIRLERSLVILHRFNINSYVQMVFKVKILRRSVFLNVFMCLYVLVLTKLRDDSIIIIFDVR